MKRWIEVFEEFSKGSDSAWIVWSEEPAEAFVEGIFETRREAEAFRRELVWYCRDDWGMGLKDVEEVFFIERLDLGSRDAVLKIWERLLEMENGDLIKRGDFIGGVEGVAKSLARLGGGPDVALGLVEEGSLERVEFFERLDRIVTDPSWLGDGPVARGLRAQRVRGRMF